MKKSLVYFFAFIALSMATQSCNKCKNVDCQNGGTCDKGICSCPSGFTGDNCELCNGKTCQNGGTCVSGACNCATGYYGDDCAISCATCSSFTGNYYSYRQNCNQIFPQYNSTVSIVTSVSNKISISNFNNKGWTVQADVSGSSFTISAQTFQDGSASWKVETTSAATLSGNTLTIPTKLTNLSTSFSCTDNIAFFKQ
jgi:hypothetical protein